MLDPILEKQSKIAKVIDEPLTCYKKSKRAVRQTKIEFFSLKFQFWYMKMGKKGDLCFFSLKHAKENLCYTMYYVDIP